MIRINFILDLELEDINVELECLCVSELECRPLERKYYLHSKVLKKHNNLTLMEHEIGEIYIMIEDDISSHLESVIDKKKYIYTTMSFNFMLDDFNKLYNDFESWEKVFLNMAEDEYEAASSEILEEFMSDIKCKYMIQESDISFLENNKKLTMELLVKNTKENILEDMLDKTEDINVSIELMSNYDCLSSFFYETSGNKVFLKESYLEDLIKMSRLNISKLKSVFDDNGIEIRDEPTKTEEELGVFSEEEIYKEFLNTCCGANRFSILLKIQARDFYNICKNKKLTIPKGSRYGFYSRFYGGGSVFDSITKKDFNIEKLGSGTYNNYTYFELLIDDINGYSISKTYGVGDEFFSTQY